MTVIVVAVGKPDGVLHRPLDLVVVRVVDAAPDLDRSHPLTGHVVEEAAHESGLRLEYVDDRGDPVGVRSVEGEQIRVAGDDRPAIGLGSIAPIVAQSPPTCAVLVQAAQVVGRVESGAIYDGVDLVFGPVRGTQTSSGEFHYERRLQTHTVNGERPASIA